MKPLAAVVLVLAGWAAIAADDDLEPSAASRCDVVIAPGDSVQRMARSLRPGQTGCLRGGVYRGNVAIRRGGQAGRPIAIRSLAGERATILGRLVIHRRAHHVMLSRLVLDGRNPRRLPSPSVAGDDAVFDGVEVTNRHTSICFTVGGPAGVGVAERTVIRRSRIHNCGRYPANNHEHGIYLARSRDARILGSWIQGNADRGIQLYPDAQRTVIRGNVVDNNGQGISFGGEGRLSSGGTLVEGNVITNSLLRGNVESFYPAGVATGVGNVVRGNCIAGGVRDGPSGGADVSNGGFELLDNLAARPRYRNRLRGDLRFSDSHPCAGLFAGDPGFTPGF